MYGAILGDIIGSPYEGRRRARKTKDFPLFIPRSHVTDDSVMTIAVAEALMDSAGQDESQLQEALVHSMQEWGHRFPHAGYGGMFSRWLRALDPQPYNSFGNGSAMRVSAAGWLSDSLDEALRLAAITASVTHNHPEGIKGASAVAGAIFLARTEKSKDAVREFVTDTIGYDLSRTCDEIRPVYHMDVSCQGSVPEAITAFLDGSSFEDAVRNAVSLGGDSDTQACIAGSIAEAYYGVPEDLIIECRHRLPHNMKSVLNRFLEVTRNQAAREE